MEKAANKPVFKKKFPNNQIELKKTVKYWAIQTSN